MKRPVLIAMTLIIVIAATSATYIHYSSITLPRSAYLYRYPIRPVTPASVDIRALEAKTKGSDPSAFDLAQLSSVYFHLGRVTGEQEWLKKAETAAKRSLAALPSPNPAKLTLAKILDSRHQFRAAIRLAEESLKDRSSPEALSVLVTSHLALGEVTEANLAADRAIETRPTLDFLLLRALALLQQGRDEEAEFDFKRAVIVEDLDSPHESSRLRAMWARHLMSRGDLKTAKVLLDESLRIWKENAFAIGMLGELELKRKNFKAAQAHFLQAFEWTKEAHYLVRYAGAKSAAGDRTVALQYWNQAETFIRRELTSSETGHRLQLAELLLDRGNTNDLQEAITLATAETKDRPSSATYFVLSQAYLSANKPMESFIAIRHCLKSGVRNALYYRLASRVENTRGNRARAAMYEELARKTDPSL